ncbi:MAG: hypothetical protein PF904_01875 [Kiritimatiellae bacterium]|jgi:type IV pilus assembly protein PilQ|nr:hypothetical protein [Kiritimatiellia bacterium]
MNITSKHIITLCSLIWLAGCTSIKAPEPIPEAPPTRSPAVAAADALYEKGQMQEAIIACIDIERKNPEAQGLLELQARINTQLTADRKKEAELRSEMTTQLSSADAKKFAITPDSYRQKKHVVGENSSLRSTSTAMQKALAIPVSIHLVNADINAIIAQIGQSQNINIIADSDISEKALTIHAEDTPLIEILEYIGRNLNVTFSVGTSLIWVTPKEEITTGVPLLTRIYKLRKGMVGSELGKTAKGKSLFKGREDRNSNKNSMNDEQDGGDNAGNIGLLESIERFVPQPEGADFLFNDKAHALIVKNSRENLELVENLIEAMDVRPLQVLIEARFVTTQVSDLRDLGIEWLFDDRGGSRADANDPSAPLGADTFASVLDFNHDALTGEITGVNDNGVGGATVGYQFLLGNTALQAVLHALQENGESRTVVVPRVTTLNNREASFRVGEDTSYFEEVDTNIMTSGSNSSSAESRDNVTYDYDSPTIVETGYSLVVTPSVGSDLASINMVLRPEISAIKEWKTYRLSSLSSTVDGESEPEIEIPIISRQYIETEAVVRSGETIVLGGLVDTSKEDIVSGTPWLVDLPLIGRWFKHTKNTETVDNILIFVTATLISDMGEELIPLNAKDRYGVPIPEGSTTPDVLKNTPPADTKPPAAATAAKSPAKAPVAAPPVIKKAAPAAPASASPIKTVN